MAVDCAGEQDQYAEMQDRLFANQRQLEPWSAHAEAVGIDTAQFEECLESGRHDAGVRTDMKEALRDVRTKVDLARAEFPDEVDFPVVEEVSFDDVPVIFFTLTGGVDLSQLREIAEDIAPDLERVDGVRHVEVFGGFEREIQIVVDPAILAEFGMTLRELAGIIEGQSRSVPAGDLRGSSSDRVNR